MIIKNGKRLDGFCVDSLPIGTLQPYLGLKAPNGYLICDGSLISKTVYPDLYTICGSLFGTETDTHFYLPDLRGKTIAGYNADDSTLNTIGKLLGAISHTHTSATHTHTIAGHVHSTGNHTLTIDEVPAHNHQIYDNNRATALASGGTEGTENAKMINGLPNSAYALGNDHILMARSDGSGGNGAHNHGNTGSTSLTTDSTTPGATGSASNYQPTMVANWIVKAKMIVPVTAIVENNLDSASEINALSAAQGKILNNKVGSHTHGLSHHSLYCPVEDVTEGGWEILDPTYSRKEVWLKSLRFRANAPEWLVGNYSTGIAFGGGDTKGVMSLSYYSPLIKFAGGNADAPSWYMGLTGSGSTTYDLNSFVQKPNVLWSNPSPKSNFSAQTISVTNLSSYSYIEVIFYNWVGGQYGYQSVKAPVENGGVVNLCFTINLYSGEDTSTCHFGSRLGTMNTSNNTIAWQTQHGAVVYVDGTHVGPNNNNQWGVPVKILGYRL